MLSCLATVDTGAGLAKERGMPIILVTPLSQQTMGAVLRRRRRAEALKTWSVGYLLEWIGLLPTIPSCGCRISPPLCCRLLPL